MHLSVPIDLTGKKHTNFQFIIDKVAAKIPAWNSCCLSQSQKLILINSVLIAMVAHVIICMEVPLSIVTKIDFMMARFFWARKGNSSCHRVKRDTIQLP